MKNLFLLVLCFAFLSFTGGKKLKNDLTKYNLKGKVKSVTYSVYSASDSAGNVVKGAFSMNCVSKFDSLGFVIESKVTGDTNWPPERIYYSYNSKHELIEEKRTAYRKADSSSETFTNQYKHDKLGNIIEKLIAKNGKLMSRTEDKLDSNSNVIEEKKYEPADSLKSIVTYLYDSKNRKIEESEYSAHNVFQHKTTYEYDKTGNCSVWKDYGSDGMPSRTYILNYTDKDKNGNCLKCVNTASNTNYADESKTFSLVEFVFEYY